MKLISKVKIKCSMQFVNKIREIEISTIFNNKKY